MESRGASTYTLKRPVVLIVRAVIHEAWIVGAHSGTNLVSFSFQSSKVATERHQSGTSLRTDSLDLFTTTPSLTTETSSDIHSKNLVL